MPVVRSNSSTLDDFTESSPQERTNGQNEAAAVSKTTSSPLYRQEDVSCSPSRTAAEDEQTVMTSSTSSNSLLSYCSSRTESEQTLRKRPSFQSLEDALAGSASTADDTDASALSSAGEKKEDTKKEECFSKPLKKVRSAQSLQDLIIPRPVEEAKLLLPDPKTVGVDPDMYLAQLVQALYGVKVQPKAALELNDFFPTITEKQMAAYSMEVVAATRENKVDKLRGIVENQGPEAVNCYNRFGESLLNLSCRRGFKDIVSFFLSSEVGLNVRTRDDCGRTPMHDACWNPEPLLDICSWLVEKDPSLFLIKDKRGYTAFQYARKSDWHIWRKFLFDNRHALEGLAEPEIVRVFS